MTQTIDLTNITFLEFEVVRSILEQDLEGEAPSAEELGASAIVFGFAINEELNTLDPAAADAVTITLRRHFTLVRNACAGLVRKVIALDTRHIEILIDAANISRSDEHRSVEATFKIYDHLTRTFELEANQDAEVELAREMPEPDWEKLSHLRLGTSDAQALIQFRATKHALSMTVN